MKLAILLSALAGASAFAPNSQSVTSQTQLNAADLETLRGVGPETGNAVVSSFFSGQNACVRHLILAGNTRISTDSDVNCSPCYYFLYVVFG